MTQGTFSPAASPRQPRLQASSTIDDGVGNVVIPFPLRPMEALEIAETLGDKEMAAAIRERLNRREDVLIGPNHFEEDTPEQISDAAIMVGSFIMVLGLAVWWF
jgi:hypothetical protein